MKGSGVRVPASALLQGMMRSHAYWSPHPLDGADHNWCNSGVTLGGMSTVHPRLALTRDPELDDALRVGASVLGPSKPTSRVARELILRGAKELLANPGPELD